MGTRAPEKFDVVCRVLLYSNIILSCLQQGQNQHSPRGTAKSQDRQTESALLAHVRWLRNTVETYREEDIHGEVFEAPRQGAGPARPLPWTKRGIIGLTNRMTEQLSAMFSTCLHLQYDWRKIMATEFEIGINV